MQIPPAIRIPICIEQGSVFNFFHDAQGAGRASKNRYFVVMNRNPKTDTVLLLVTPTTQSEKRLAFVRGRGISEKTIVNVLTTEYQPFSHDCVFDCNGLVEVKMSDLIARIEADGSDHYPKMPDTILSRLIHGVKESPMVSDEQKGVL